MGWVGSSELLPFVCGTEPGTFCSSLLVVGLWTPNCFFWSGFV